jgi:oligopeptide transport system substrate-binding protein
MQLKKSFKNIFFLLFCCSISSCGKNNSTSFNKSSQEITINIVSDPATLDQRKARLLSDYNIIRTFNEGLFRVNKEGVSSPAICENYKISQDQKTYTFTLKETLWSNGDPLTAHDFIYTWRSSLAKDFLSPNASLLFPLKNAKSIKSGLLPASMLGVSAENDYTLVVELETPTPFFLELLAMPIYFPVNKTVIEEYENWATDPSYYVCNGPFKLNSWSHKNQIIAVKNDLYWDTNQVKLKKIKMVMVDQDTDFSMFQNKELDWSGSPYSDIPFDAIANFEDNTILKKDPFLATCLIRINTNVFPLQDKNFRKSLACSINRKEIVEDAMSGSAQIATGIVPFSMGLEDSPNFIDNDEISAKKNLEDACKRLSIADKTLPVLTLTYVGSPSSNKVVAVLQDQWRKALNITVELDPVERKVYIDRISKGDYELAYGNWFADFKDPISFLEVFKTKHVGTNNTGWESLDYIKAIDASYNCASIEERNLALKESEKIIMDEMPVIPIYHHSMIHLQDQKLKDVILTSTGNIDFKCAYILD